MKTRYKEIEIVNDGPGLWRYVIDGARTGPHFATRIEALAYIDTEAKIYGLVG